MFKSLTVGPGHISTMRSTRQRHAAATRAPRGATSAPRRRHVGAVVRGSPAVAGGERRRPDTRGWGRSREEAEGNKPVAAPLARGRRSCSGEQATRRRLRVHGGAKNQRGRRRTGTTRRELSSPRLQRSSRGGQGNNGDGGIELDGARTGERGGGDSGRSTPSRLA